MNLKFVFFYFVGYELIMQRYINCGKDILPNGRIVGIYRWEAAAEVNDLGSKTAQRSTPPRKESLVHKKKFEKRKSTVKNSTVNIVSKPN